MPAPTAANPGATRAHKRQVQFSGVLRQAVAGDLEEPRLLGAGYFILLPLPGAITETIDGPFPAKPESREIRFQVTN